MQSCPYKLLVAMMALAHEVSFHLLFIKLLAVAENLTDFILKCPRFVHHRCQFITQPLQQTALPKNLPP